MSSPGSNRSPYQGDDAQAAAMQKVIDERISVLQAEIERLDKELEGNPEDPAVMLQLGDSRYLLGEMYYMVGEYEKAEGNLPPP